MHRVASTADESAARTVSESSTWREKYGANHKIIRISQFPAGIAAPKKVRIYSRRDHYILQFWDPHSKRTQSVRVAGDLIDALSEARKLDIRLEDNKHAGLGARKLSHADLVDQFIADLHRRADAGEIATTTVNRYESALCHYRAFCERPEIAKCYRTAASVNREFRLAFSSYAATNIVKRGNTPARLSAQSGPVFDAVRTMFNWACTAERGNLLPIEFRNPFERIEKAGRQPARDPFGEPDITVAMAAEFIDACDDYQFPLFTTLILYGLRAAEPRHLFHEHHDENWLKVPCIPELDYLTKGQRDKRFPLISPIGFHGSAGTPQQGLLFTRRQLLNSKRSAPLAGASLHDLTQEFKKRCDMERQPSAATRQLIREQVLRFAGGLNYDHIEHEFRAVAEKLHWPRAATIKDFRHLFSTCLENSGVPEFYRRYFMGQSPGKSAIVTYTHLNELRQQFDKAAQDSMEPIVSAIRKRSRK
jgi:integrase